MENHRHRTALARRTDRRALQITSATPTMTKQNRTMIFCPKSDGTYVVEFRTAAGESMAISIPRGETTVIRHFQERMPYGLFVPEVDSG
jgi:hypothetical protein